MEEIMNTKQKILYTSLKLFSDKGYDGVSMREIAAAVGIKGASIYNHFKGKEAIFQGIFDEMNMRCNKFSALLEIPNEDSVNFHTKFTELKEMELLSIGKDLFSFYALDEFVAQFRKLAVVEQYRSPLAAQALKDYYFDAPIQYQTKLFEKMQECGMFKGYLAKTMALHFYSPIYYLLSRYDLEQDYEKCIVELEHHVHWFSCLYNK